MKKKQIKSVVFKGKRLPSKHLGSWAFNDHHINPKELTWMLPYVIEICGKPPYNLTIEVR